MDELFGIEIGGLLVADAPTVSGTIALCQTFVAGASKTVDFVDISVRSLTAVGTVAGGLYAVDANGLPTGAALATLTAAAPTAAKGHRAALSAGVALTAGTRYAWVFALGTGTNWQPYWWSGCYVQGWQFAYTAIVVADPNINTSRWNTAHGCLYVRWHYTDGTTDGVGMGQIPTHGNNANLYGSDRMDAVKFTPLRPIAVVGVECFVLVSGTAASAGALVAKLYRGTTLLATATARSAADFSTSTERCKLAFASPVRLAANTEYTLVFMQSAAGGDAANYILIRGFTTTTTPGGYLDAPTTAAMNQFYGAHSYQSTTGFANLAQNAVSAPAFSLICAGMR